MVATGGKHGAQFEGRTGQENDQAVAAFVLAGNPLARRGAVWIRQDDGSGDHVGLLEVVGRKFVAARREALFQLLQNFFTAMQFQSESFGDRFACKVIFGGAESAHENDDVRAEQGMLRN